MKIIITLLIIATAVMAILASPFVDRPSGNQRGQPKLPQFPGQGTYNPAPGGQWGRGY